MEAHARDLRVEVEDDGWVGRIKTDYRQAKLTEADRALCDYATKLTGAPASITRDDVDALRAAGLSDRAIHDATQVIAYFNYINRIADGLGVDPEPEWACTSPLESTQVADDPSRGRKPTDNRSG